MKMKNTMLLSLCAFATIALSGCSTTNTKLATEGVLVVGMECGYAPFNWTETTSTDSNVAIANVANAYTEGYDVQVAKIIAEELNLTLQIKALEFTGLIQALNTNQIDLIIAGMSPTQERKSAIDFTDGYYRSTHVMLVKSASSYASATNLDGFSGAKVIGQMGTIYASLVEQVVAHGAIAGTDLDTVPEIVNAIVNGNIDATILEEPVAKGVVSQYEGLTYVTLSDGFEVSEEDVVVSIGCRKGFELENEINQILTNTITNERRLTLMEQAITMAPASN